VQSQVLDWSGLADDNFLLNRPHDSVGVLKHLHRYKRVQYTGN